MPGRDRVDPADEGTEPSTGRRFRRTVTLGTSGAVVIAIAGLLGYAPGLRILASVRPDFVPMAPFTAVGFLVLGVALIGLHRHPAAGKGEPGLAALGLLVAVVGLLDIIGNVAGLDLTGKKRLMSGMGYLDAIPIGLMSVVTSFAFVIVGTGVVLVCLRSWRGLHAERLGHAASSLGVLTVLLGGIVLLGYAFGTPLMYKSSTVPMAATTAAAFLCVGVALVATAGPASFPISLVVGDSLSARLSRAFLGLTASALLLEGILAEKVTSSLAANAALLTSALIIAMCGIAAFLVARVSRSFGARLEENTRMLRASEERWQFAMEGSGDGVWDWNLETGEAVFSTQWKRMLGYAEHEIANCSEEWVTRVHPDDLPGVMATIQAHLDGATASAVVENRLQAKDGTWRWILGRGLVVDRDAEGKPLRMVGTNTDITERRQTEDNLRELTGRLHLATASAQEAVWDWDLLTNEMIWDARMFELYGLTPETFPGGISAWQQGLHPDDATRAIAECEAAIRGEQVFDTEFRVRRPDGTVVHVKANGLVVRAADGTPLRMTGVNSDVTARRRAQVEREVMHQIGQSVATSANLDELLTRMHQALRRVLHAENCFVALYDEATGLFSFPYFIDEHDETPAPVAMPESCTAYVLRRGQPALITPAVFRELQEHGEVMRVGAPSLSWMGVPLRTPSGVIGVLVVQEYTKEDVYSERDLEFLASVGGQAALVIERKLVEATLRDREAELNVILESTADGLLAVDNTGKVLRTNRRFAEMWRIPDAIMASKDDATLLGHVVGQVADPAAFVAKVQSLYHSTESSRDRVAFADGRVFVRRSTPLVNDGANVGRVWTFHDITERVRTEEAKAGLEDRLHHVEKMESVGRLAGGVAHEFNNMLAVILGFTELSLARVDAAHPVRADLLEVQKAAQRSANLTRQLLAFARKQTVQPIVLDVNDTVSPVLSMLQQLIGANIRVTWAPGAGLWPIMKDPSQLAGVLTDLCLNARDAIGDVGTIALETANCAIDAAFCATHPDAVPGDYVRLSVRDTGCGMAVETLDKIFEPFFTTKGVGEGTGLGLASVYGAVKQNSGFITVASAVGQGTTFDLYWPRLAVEVKTTQRPGMVTLDARGHETILLVEDEPAVLRFTTRALSAQGYAVLSANSPAEAVRLAQEHPDDIHLLLSDVVMPEMSGRALASAALVLRPTLKHLFMSGHTADVVAREGMLDPGVAFIEKPFTMAALAAKVREVLDGP